MLESHYKKRDIKPRFLAAFLQNAAKAFPLSRVFHERGSKERLEPRFWKNAAQREGWSRVSGKTRLKTRLKNAFCDLKLRLWVTFSRVFTLKKHSYMLPIAAFSKNAAIGSA